MDNITDPRVEYLLKVLFSRCLILSADMLVWTPNSSMASSRSSKTSSASASPSIHIASLPFHCRRTSERCSTVLSSFPPFLLPLHVIHGPVPFFPLRLSAFSPSRPCPHRPQRCTRLSNSTRSPSQIPTTPGESVIHPLCPNRGQPFPVTVSAATL